MRKERDGGKGGRPAGRGRERSERKAGGGRRRDEDGEDERKGDGVSFIRAGDNTKLGCAVRPATNDGQRQAKGGVNSSKRKVDASKLSFGSAVPCGNTESVVQNRRFTLEQTSTGDNALSRPCMTPLPFKFSNT